MKNNEVKDDQGYFKFYEFYVEIKRNYSKKMKLCMFILFEDKNLDIGRDGEVIG